MAQAEVVTVRMSRGNTETPWGFDITPPTQISNVVVGSLADRAGLLNGDTLVELEGYSKPDYQLAKQLLSKAEHKIELVVHRDAGYSARLWKPSVTENAEYSRFQHSVHNVAGSGNQERGRIPPPPPPPPQSSTVPIKVSLEHQPQVGVNIPGFNVKAQPYGAKQEVKHLQYNSPMPIYSPQTAAEQYLQQTGGLFGTDPHVAKMTEVPAYLRSETLRLIQEDDARKEISREMSHPITVQATERETSNINANTSSMPQCYSCGRSIQGVMCRAFDHYFHPECFRCATCGTALKNQGHHYINGKFYCNIHGRQFDSRSQLHPDLAVRSPPTAVSPKRNQDNLRAPYQPEIMTRRPLSISPTPWKTQSPISPSNRGVPHSAVQYGQDLRHETYTSPPMTTTSIVDDNEEHHTFDLTKHAPLPKQIHCATSPRRRPSTRIWPPEGPAVRKFWRYDNKAPPPNIEKVVSLTSYIKELDEEQHRPPSPKRHLLRGEPKTSLQSYHSDIGNVHTNANLQPNVPKNIVSEEINIVRPEKLQEDYQPVESTSKIDQSITTNQGNDDNTVTVSRKLIYKNEALNQNIPTNDPTSEPPDENDSLLTFAPQLVVKPPDELQYWAKTAEILEEGDLATEKSFTQQNEEDECGSLPSFDKDTTDFLNKGASYFCDEEESVTPVDEEKSEHYSEGEYEVYKMEQMVNTKKPELTEIENERKDAVVQNLPNNESKKQGNLTDYDKELWMKEEIEQAKQESLIGAQLEQKHLEELRLLGDRIQKDIRSVIKPKAPQRSSKPTRAELEKQRSLEAEKQRVDDIKRVEEIREQNIARLAELGRTYEAVWHEDTPHTNITHQMIPSPSNGYPNQIIDEKHNDGSLQVYNASKRVDEQIRLEEKKKEEELEELRKWEEMKRQDENDKRLAIESIERHQRQLQEQQVQLSQLLDNAIIFLKNLDTEFMKRSPEPYYSKEKRQETHKQDDSCRQRIDEIEQYDNVRSDIPQHQNESVEEMVQAYNTDPLIGEASSGEAGLLDFDTPSARIMRAIHELDCTFFVACLKRRSEIRTSKEVKPFGGSDRLSGMPHISTGTELQTPSDKIVNALQNLEIRQSSMNNNTTSSRTQHTYQSSDNMRGRGVLQAQGSRIPYCEQCRNPIRGAYVLANGLAYCPDHFVCANRACNRKLLEIGFVEEKGLKYCERCFETLIAPHCAKCDRPIVADCLNALQKQWHPECFVCNHCQKPFGNSAFFLEQGQPYCEEDWNALFTTRCIACNFPIEAGDRWVEALGSAFHSNCFNCTACNVNLEGESFYAKNGAPYCKLHA